MKYYQNYILKKLTKEEAQQIIILEEKAKKYWKNKLFLEPQIIPYSFNNNYYWYKVDK
jgi:hypothetical protein